MIRLIEENLVRQNKAMVLLFVLLEEEFSRLNQGQPQGVSQIELSIQELMRQVAAERRSLRAKIDTLVPGAVRVRELYVTLKPETSETLEKLLEMLDDTEQKCAVQAAKNNEMAMALFEQSSKLLTFMHNQIKPKNSGAYAPSGRLARAPSSARLLTGRL
ncbi:flagellar protein FlgN [Pseudodesulfovibrio sp. F-1]|uniref:Flagellar protein FlgN n=1 Tax=Pseudodesulfovibrio alkaliphilus TaxID=2661613 RepID=A0A7K1KJ05_9BACT|nr:flagellar export chaperone FlgN [Pseudodesulfovibrio alkaliphilus]MUM76049.1 flagellar protein FlgN [Pseudodesulfovibrio alkaliphilus]